MSKEPIEYTFSVDDQGKLTHVRNQKNQHVELFLSIKHAKGLSMDLTLNPKVSQDSDTEIKLTQGEAYEGDPPGGGDKPVAPGNRNI